MFTENIGMNVLLRNVKVAGKSETQTRGIQRGAGADDLVFRDAGDFHEHVGDDVHRIADDDVQRVRCGLCDVRCNAFDDVDIRLRQFKARLTGFSGHAGRNDDDVGVLCILVISRFNGNRVAEAGTLNDIHHFALCLLLVDVDQDNLRCDVFVGKRICNGCTYATGTNHGDFAFHCPGSLPFLCCARWGAQCSSAGEIF